MPTKEPAKKSKYLKMPRMVKFKTREKMNHFLSDQKIDRSAANHEDKKAPVPPTVKEVAGQEEKNVLGAMVQPPVEKNDGDEEKKERRRVKKHGTQSD